MQIVAIKLIMTPEFNVRAPAQGKKTLEIGEKEFYFLKIS